MTDIRSIPDAELGRRWRELRDALLALPPESRGADDLQKLLAMRREIDRRTAPPSVEVDFENYLTD